MSEPLKLLILGFGLIAIAAIIKKIPPIESLPHLWFAIKKCFRLL